MILWWTWKNMFSHSRSFYLINWWGSLKNRFFQVFPQFLQEKRKSLKTQFLRGFLFIFRLFPIFLRDFLIFLRHFRKIFEAFTYFSKLDLVEVFPLFLRSFLLYLRRFRFLEAFPLFLRIFRFSKKLLKLYFFEAFPIIFLRRFLFFKKVLKLYFVEAFLL